MLEKTTDYYDRTAEKYDELHGGDDEHEHTVALERAWPILGECQIESAVDVGCGTGRSLAWMRSNHDHALDLTGVDPSVGLLKLARERLEGVNFISGSGEALPLEDESVDLAVATGIMHHVDSPEDVIREMFRVAKKAVLISDHNNFAFRAERSRKLRLWLHASGLLKPITFVKQGFRKQGYSEDDGWWYPYSLLNDFGLISSLSSEQYIVPTRPSSADRGNLLLTQSHMAILAFKPQPELPQHHPESCNARGSYAMA